MKINGTDLQSQLSVYKTAQLQGNKIETAKTTTANAAGAQQDRVALSEQGRMIADAQRAVAFIPDVRESLVSEVRNDLESGSYVFDNQRSAEGILKESMVNEAAMSF
ncbi:FlgM: predicted flagellar biosynthesis anti-sigma factor [Desulfosarcina variabilis str. Montpellier]|jgi:negative regulator of flagellin synthesis FlgM|uniref:flagellar biosynthesis anti-sigma factor FlgM n=1 Tax=Desulfosarcina variabilis TaxID=2300 RepID=UPI003AFB5DB2